MNDPYQDNELWDPDRKYEPIIIPPGILALTPQAQQEKDFKSFDTPKLYQMSARQLAEWKQNFNLVPAAQTLADHHFKLREGAPARELAKRAMFLSVVSLVVTVLLFIIGYLINRH